MQTRAKDAPEAREAGLAHLEPWRKTRAGARFEIGTSPAIGLFNVLLLRFSGSARPKRIVITGGPGAGKTAILELARRDLCAHVEVLPESARIVFSGGFPRRADVGGRRAAQRAIYHVQKELERLADDSARARTTLCDRGTLDGLAYWPGSPEEYTEELGTTIAAELARYSFVLHLRVPDGSNGYTNDSQRIESVREAQDIDARLVDVWAAHPRRVFVDSSSDFVRKAQRALAVIRAELTCCATKGPRAA